ncbi:uncharacterized protein CLUP02_15034 [Colletotrichum lupini]|uniref:Uncharacterized protein n=1 Tax=Colletotrichum lupini TaxID=145971 RepID=A0A9Q8T5B6_9PEZI|nr:uncharacterized protein CLUP02_15034 [Colletotrichum lupini]UQC89503.1 hypothetical protein CLUP02_15034 [Colletotrichum lupini]
MLLEVLHLPIPAPTKEPNSERVIIHALPLDASGATSNNWTALKRTGSCIRISTLVHCTATSEAAARSAGPWPRPRPHVIQNKRLAVNLSTSTPP